MAIEYQAASVNGVMRPGGVESFVVDVTIDDKPVPEAMRGDDTQPDEAGRTFVLVDEIRLYNIIQSAEVGRHELKAGIKLQRLRSLHLHLRVIGTPLCVV